MPSKHPLLLLLGGLAVLGLGTLVGLMISKGDKSPPAIGHAPKTLAKTRNVVPISALPTQTSIPALRTATTVEATGLAGEEPTQEYVPSPEPYVPKKEEKKPIVTTPPPSTETSGHGTVTVGPNE